MHRLQTKLAMLNPKDWVKPSTFKKYIQSELVRRARKTLRALPPDNNSTTPRRLYLDLSVIANHDAGTGIQRVVRAVALHLLQDHSSTWEIHTVKATRKRGYGIVKWPSEFTYKELQKIQGRPGDVFLGLDFSLDAIYLHKKQLRTLQRQGVQMWFLMYDLLPVQRPEWFSEKLVVRYQRWLNAIAAFATGFFCISPTVAEDLKRYLANEYSLPLCDMPKIDVLPMGYDLLQAPHSTGVSEKLLHVLEKIAEAPTALMVGTLEPRKGHAEILKAFDQIWSDGERLNLVIVGRPGWKTEALQQQLKAHPLRDHNLFWLDDATDEEVEALYKACSGVIVASHAEGFGLPLIEGLGHKKKVLVRDIPVFKAHRLHGVSYFSANNGSSSLANTIKTWLQDDSGVQGDAPSTSLPTWAKSAEHVISTLSAA